MKIAERNRMGILLSDHRSTFNPSSLDSNEQLKIYVLPLTFEVKYAWNFVEYYYIDLKKNI